MSHNQAAWIPSKHSTLVVQEAPFPSLSSHEIIISNHAIALNPFDQKIQEFGVFLDSFPFILGFEVAGRVHSVGSAVTRFKPGDRAVALAAAVRTKNIGHAGFQLYTAANEMNAAPIPDNIEYEQAVALPIGVATAVAGFYEPVYFGLPYPSPPKPSEGNEQVILIWGGASVVGSCAIQLAILHGMDVATTASAKNASYMKTLGAKHVFDYNNDDVVAQATAALKKYKNVVGVFDAISTEATTDACAEILHALGGGVLCATRMGERKEPVLLVDVKRHWSECLSSDEPPYRSQTN